MTSDPRTLLVGGSLLAGFVLFRVLKHSARQSLEPAAARPVRERGLEAPDPELGAWAE